MSAELTNEVVWARTEEGPWEFDLDEVLESGDLFAGDFIWTGKAVRIATSRFVRTTDIDAIVDAIWNNAGDCAGVSEETLNYPSISCAARLDLKQRIENWLDEHDKPHFTEVGQITLYRLTEDDVKDYS